MSNTFNIKRTATNGDGVALHSMAHPRPISKIDVIIDALSVAQNSIWSALNQEALAYAIELKLELAKPTLRMSPEHLPQFIATNNIKTTTEGGGGAGSKEWVGLSINEGRDFFESKLTRAELIAEINEFLEEKNT
jgi:hypothetical protein